MAKGDSKSGTFSSETGERHRHFANSSYGEILFLTLAFLGVWIFLANPGSVEEKRSYIYHSNGTIPLIANVKLLLPHHHASWCLKSGLASTSISVLRLTTIGD